MAVHLTRIYTKTGDDGTTALGDFSRVRKTDVRLAAYADTDEANAAIGVAVTVGGLAEERRWARCGRCRTTCSTSAPTCARRSCREPEYPPLRVTEDYVTRLEGWCDAFNADLPKLASFILPGGTPGAALLHVARTVTRRAERSVWALLEADPERTNPLTARYLNRLSDLLFILAGWRTRTATCCGSPVAERDHALTNGADSAVARTSGRHAVARRARAARTPARTGSR